MTPPDPDPARNRWLAMTLARVAGAGGAIFGIVLAARATTTNTKLLGIGLVLAALYMIATVPRALARRWRTPRE